MLEALPDVDEDAPIAEDVAGPSQVPPAADNAPAREDEDSKEVDESIHIDDEEVEVQGDEEARMGAADDVLAKSHEGCVFVSANEDDIECTEDLNATDAGNEVSSKQSK